jgi:hypothetical protein
MMCIVAVITTLLSVGLKPIQQRKLLRAIAEKNTALDVSQADSDNSQTSLPMDIDPIPATCTSNPVHSSSPNNPECCDTAQGLSIRYIHCQNLFTHQAEEKALHNVPPTATLEELITQIASTEGVAKDETLELFFGEGYPLDPNEITLKGDLCNCCSI